MNNLNSTPIRLNPHIRDKILLIANALDCSIQGIANYLLDKIIDEAVKNVLEFEKSLDNDMKEAIKKVIKERYKYESKKNICK
ncbi:MAG: hypothetical protein QXF76_03980 [Candidatus Anstonellales archaeon]